MATVLFFARARELAQTSEETFEVPADCTLADLITLVGAKFPALLKAPAPLLENCAFSLNQNYVLEDAFATTLVRSGDEVALIPPVSGG